LTQKVTIVGAGVGGLALAALLASSQKYTVRVLEKQAGPGGKASVRRSEGFVYDEGPSILVLKAVYEDLFRKLGEPMDKWLNIQTVKNPFRIFTRGEDAFELGSSWEESIANIMAWNADAGFELAAFQKKLNRYAGILGLSYCDRAVASWHDFARWPLMASGVLVSPFQKYKIFVDQHISHPVLREFLYGFPGYAGFHPARAPASMALLPWSLLTEGVFYPEGGVQAIPQALFRYCKSKGVEFHFNCAVNDLECEGILVKTLITQNANLAIEPSEKVVFNGCLGWLTEKLNKARQPSPIKASELAHFSEQSPSFLTIQTSFPRAQRDAFHLRHHNLFLPGQVNTSYQDINVAGADFPQDPPLYLNVPSVVDPHVAPEGFDNAFLVVSVPSHLPEQKHSRVSEEKLAAARYLNLLRQALPGLKLGEIYVRGSVAFENDFFQKGGQIYGPSLDHAQKVLGMVRPGPMLHKDSNLMMVGGSTQPGAGLPMVIQSAKIVAQLIMG
jgi:phytoene desaturase